MKKEEQDKLWAELPEESKKEMREMYASFSAKTDPQSKGYCLGMANVFGAHNLKSLQTYEDVARELFRDNKRVYYFKCNGDDRIHSNVHSADDSWYMAPLNCASEAQANKLAAINRLLNVAKLLNRNEDSSDWVPDWNDVDEPKFYPFVRKGSLSLEDTYMCNSHIVYFRTKELYLQAVQILGEEEIMKALTTGY